MYFLQASMNPLTSTYYRYSNICLETLLFTVSHMDAVMFFAGRRYIQLSVEERMPTCDTKLTVLI